MKIKCLKRSNKDKTIKTFKLIVLILCFYCFSSGIGFGSGFNCYADIIFNINSNQTYNFSSREYNIRNENKNRKNSQNTNTIIIKTGTLASLKLKNIEDAFSLAFNEERFLFERMIEDKKVFVTNADIYVEIIESYDNGIKKVLLKSNQSNKDETDILNTTQNKCFFYIYKL